MNAAKSVGATFQPAGYLLAVSLRGDGAGNVKGGPIDCGDGGSACSGSVPQGTTVVLTEKPGTSSLFTGWGIVCTGTAQTCSVRMNAAKTEAATFQPSTYPLTVRIVGAGSVTGPDGTCSSGTCTYYRPYGSAVPLTAAPDGGSSFSKWSGNCRGPAPTCSLTMTSPWSVTATFKTR
jgi:hypothetical protein